MNNKISTGIWFVFLGLIILLHNLDIISFDFYAIIKYWPLALVSVGVSLLLQGKSNGVLISTAVNLSICIFLLVIGTTSSNHSDTKQHTASYGTDQKSVSTEYHGVPTASIEINGGATKYLIKDLSDTSKLFEAKTAGSNIHLELEEKNDNKLQLDMQVRGNESNSPPVALSFHQQPHWDITFNVGAVTVEGNLSDHRIKNFVINSGASSFKLKFGKPTDGTGKIEINTAASSIKLLLPQDVEYYVKSENVISSTKIKGKKQKGKGSYKTDNYDRADHKYYIEISGAANSFSLETY